MNPINPNLTLNLNREGFGSAENLQAIVTAMNAVLATIDASNNISLSIAYMDASFSYRDASLDVLLTLSKVHDASIGLLQIDDGYVDTSLNALELKIKNKDIIYNASLGALQTDDINMDISINAIDLRAFNSQIIYNASVGVLTAKGLSVDTSLSAIDLRAFNQNIITNASLGLTTHRYALGSGIGKSMLLGIKDASGAVGDFIMSDVSLYFKFGSSAATGYWAVMNASIVTFG